MKRQALRIAAAAVASVACGLAAAAVFRVLQPPPAGERPALAGAEWEAYGYRVVRETHHRQFNVRGRLGRVPGKTAAARLLFCQQDSANYYFVEFTDRETWIGKVQLGMEAPIGARGGSAMGPDTSREVIVKRRDLAIKVYVDGAPVATALDDTFSAGGVLLGQPVGSGSADAFRVQSVGDIVFGDDFMRAATAEGQWSAPSGKWEVATLKNPGLSSNAFSFVGRATADGPAVAVTGHWFWDDYAFQISCQPTGSKTIGVLAYYRGPDDYYAFRWSAAAEGGRAGKKQLVRRRGGEEVILAEAVGGYSEGQWYRLLISVQGDEIATAIDDNAIFRVRDPLLCCGQIGVLTEGPGSACFDDVYVVSGRSLADSFEEPGTGGRWLELGGTWEAKGGEQSRMVARSDGRGKAICGADRWGGYQYGIDLAEWRRGNIGLCAHYQGEGDYYLLRWQPGRKKVQLIMMAGGVETVLGEKDWAGPDDFPCRFSLDLSEGLVRGYAGGKLLVDALMGTGPLNGRVGLLAENAHAAFDNLRVSFRPPPEPLLTVNKVFAGENSMAEWSRSESDWIAHHAKDAGAGPEPGNGGGVVAGQDQTPHHLYWHRVDFIGDCGLEASLRGEDRDAVGDGSYALTLAGDGESEFSGYTLTLRNGPRRVLSLRRNGKVVSPERDVAAEPGSMKLGRVGRYVMGYIDGRRILSFRDPEPLTDQRAAFGTDREGFDTANLTVYSPNLWAYNFHRAPVEWRQAGGVWQVTNRWQCDPRWSFFSGESDGVAAIWSKRLFEGDLTLEFTASIKMDGARGSGYDYATDINATICADGEDLTTGYSFLFGGRGNSGTQIVRRSEVVKESRVRLPQSVMHRRWFNIKIRKLGSLLTFWIDNSKVLEYDDPAPLEGRRLALWTHKNGLMVARVRISSESGRQMEPPGAAHSRVARCLYD